jgi:DNA-binding MarR family transcriptional regulator
VVNDLPKKRAPRLDPGAGPADETTAVATAVREERAFFRDLIPVAGIDSEAALSIVRAGHFLLAAFAANARAHGVSEPQVNVLVAVEDRPEGRTMAEIARCMLVSRAGILGVVRGLEDKGYVTCTPCTEDARALRVRITRSGQAVLDTMLPGHLALVDDLVGSCFTRPEKEHLVGLLTRLRERMAARRAVKTSASRAALGPPDRTSHRPTQTRSKG